jgi:hypothetical protein
MVSQAKGPPPRKLEDLPVGSSTQTIILSSARPPVPHLGDAEKSAPATRGANVCARHCFGAPENRDKKRGLALYLQSPKSNPPAKEVYCDCTAR